MVKSTKLAGTRGTSHHGKDKNGRSPEIEKLIDYGVEWLTSQLSLENENTVLDLGCDYGYMLARIHDAANLDRKNLVGVDLYHTKNPFKLKILREDFADPLFVHRLGQNAPMHYDLIILNHTLEHVANPHIVAQNLRILSECGSRIFVAVPDQSGDWATWDGHLTLWSERFLTHFMGLHGFRTVIQTTKCFRGNLKEIWGIYK